MKTTYLCISRQLLPSFFESLVALSGVVTLGLLAGCAVTETSAPAAMSAAVSGSVHGGQQAVSGSQIFLYVAGTGGNGKGATNLLTNPVYTDGNGFFSLTSDYHCQSSSEQVYLVASGGNPGQSGNVNNSNLLMMAALGDCGNLDSNTFTNINEVTTVAAAWALAPFAGANAVIGSTATNTTGLRNAFLVANNLANTSTGLAGGAALPAGTSFESKKLYALANALAPCVNSAGGSPCSPLFAAATVGGSVPATTLDAALYVVRNPTNNIRGVFGAASASPPFQPALTAAPHDWTMSVSYTGGGIYSPTSVALDSAGSVWVANYYGGVASKLSASGIPASSSGYADGALLESYGIAVDYQDNAWVTNEESNSVNNGFGTLSKFSSNGSVLSGSGFTSSIYYPYAIAGDTNGEMWVADEGHSQVSLLDNSGNSLIGANGYQSGLTPLPVAVAIDGSHNAWFAGQGTATRVSPLGVFSQFSCCSGAAGIAIDQNQAVWVTDYAGSALVQLSSSGTVQQTISAGGGVYYPQGIAIDGAGSVWVTNYHGDTISAFTAASNGGASVAISPSYGLGVDAGLIEPFGIALDASGNVWVANFAMNAVTQFVGLASPVKTPLLGPPTAP